MRIILTHEQADFDALASLLGAHLLDEVAIPILPHRLNRNVRAFNSLYGVDLPFIEQRDLPNEPVEFVTLVDTQAMVSIKGMSSETRVRVIDHHPLREGLPEDWKIERVDVGATTTLLIEALRERDGVLNPIQSTLLLLGIYEDTGSLTYTRTTPRDLRAAAYLLDQGASLKIAANYLNHPLSPAQQALYDHLHAQTEVLNIHGHSVAVSIGEAQEMEEELSSIAHKLRDLLDPDALFVLVTTKGGVQMIARSTSDQIDVAEIISRFGGGGHERAAAGLVRGRELEELRRELVSILPDLIRPAVTVAQIMSRGPQVLSPDTPVEEAAERMRRYGYEGYPVVKNGKVVGLLTRREVDRAVGHNLTSMTAGRLMQAGEVTTRPDDSIEHLQRLVSETGWGQIPVVHPASGEIIGIVTRTDLLKNLAEAPRLPSRNNLAGRLEAALPPDRLALLRTIAGAAHEQHAALYIVGGFVRDLLLERPSLDFDLVVEGDAIALARALQKTYGGRVTSHARFGTAKWYLGGSLRSVNGKLVIDHDQPPPPGSLEFIDLITARTEFYTHPTALPTVERGSIKLDLHRRDFTINTLALRLDGRHFGELHDYWGGLNDLRHGLVRVLHSLSFVDDPTRILRAVRFEQRFHFKIEERTLQLLREAVSLLDRVSGDRIRHELSHILDEAQPAQILARLDELGLLVAIHPALKWDSWLQSRIETLPTDIPDPDWCLPWDADNRLLTRRRLAYTLWLLRLPEEAARSAGMRLRVSAELMGVVLAARGLWQALPELADATPSQAVERLEDLPPLSRYAVYLATSDIRLRKILQSYATRWRKITPSITGDDLRARGLPPSPAYRRILTGLRNAWLDGQITTIEEENTLLEKLISKEGTGDKG